MLYLVIWQRIPSFLVENNIWWTLSCNLKSIQNNFNHSLRKTLGFISDSVIAMTFQISRMKPLIIPERLCIRTDIHLLLNLLDTNFQTKQKDMKLTSIGFEITFCSLISRQFLFILSETLNFSIILESVLEY